MRAKLFFKTLDHGRKMQERTRSMELLDLCDIATIALAPVNYKTVREHLLKRAFPEKKKFAHDIKDERTAHMLSAAFHSVLPKAVSRGR